MNRLQDKVIIVTGSAAGIGAACARRYAGEGAKVVIADIAAEEAGRVADAIVAGGGDATAVPVDVADEASIVSMVETTVRRYGRLDVLHNNAALQSAEVQARDTAVADLDAEIFDRTLAVNLRGYLLCAKHAIPVLIDGGGGTIVNNSSRAGSDGEVRLTAYGVSKAGIDVLTKYIATQYGKQGIRCNALVIAGVMTERLLENTDEAYRTRIARHLLVPGLATPEQIADAALFLASDESSYVTGHLLAVDGGWGAHNPRFADTMDAMQAAR